VKSVFKKSDEIKFVEHLTRHASICQALNTHKFCALDLSLSLSLSVSQLSGYLHVYSEK